MARQPLPVPLPWDPGALIDPSAIIARSAQAVAYPDFIRRDPTAPRGVEPIQLKHHSDWSYRRALGDDDRVCCIRALECSEWNLVVHSPGRWLDHGGEGWAVVAHAGSTDHRSGQAWLIRLSEVASPGPEPLLYLESNGYPSRTGLRFDDWFLDTWKRMIRRIGPGHARRYIDGPRPFTAEESEIVAAWRGFSWEIVGRYDEGIHIRVVNASRGRLRRFTIRVRDERLVGAFWLDVQNIGPGSEAVITQSLGGYAHLTSTRTLQLEGMPEPAPHTRRDYSEFRHLHAR